MRPLGEPRAFRLLAARRVRDGRRVLLVRRGPGADLDASRAALARLAHAHARISHPAVPRTSAAHLDAPDPEVELDFPAVTEGFDIVARLASTSTRFPYAAGDAFVVGLREAMQAAHAAPGGPFCLGRLAIGNVVFDAAGRAALIGFGANVVTDDERGRADPRVRFFHAPELIAGAPPTPMTDFVALLQLARSVLPHVELPAALERVVHGRSGPAERALVALLRWVESRVIHEAPALRVGLREAVAAGSHIRRMLGVELDREGFPRVVRGLLAAGLEPQAEDADVLLAPDYAWIEPRGGPRRRLGAGPRRILATLHDRLALGDPAAWTTWELFEIGWPGEEPSYEVGVNRVHAALSRMRKLGLGDALERHDDGYRLAPGASVLRLRSA